MADRIGKVGFLSQICIACYSMLYRILPNTRPMYAMALNNLDRWKARADRIERKLSHPDVEIESNTDEDSETTGVMDELEEPFSKLKIREEPALVVDVVHETVSWEEDAEDITDSLLSGEMPRTAIWKDIDGEKWIGEEAAGGSLQANVYED